MNDKTRCALRVELARRDWSQNELARRIGTKPNTLSDWLLGNRKAPEDLLRRIERALGVPANSLTHS